MRDAVVRQRSAGQRPFRQRSVRLAVVAAAGLIAGLLPGTESASGGQAGRVALTYSCRFPAGVLDVAVGLEQSYPAAGTDQKPIQPGPLTVTLAMARARVAGLLPAGAVAVGGTASLAVQVAEGASRATADWGGLAAPPTPLVGTGDLTLTFAGPVAPVSVTAGGAVTFAAADLSLDLQVQQEGSPSPSPRAVTPAAPGKLAVSCALRAGGNAQLGSVAVPAASPSVRPSHSPSPAPVPSPKATNPITVAPVVVHSDVDKCPPPPEGQLDPRRLPTPPPGSIVLPRPGLPPFPPVPACAYADGYANVAKLGEAALINDPRNHPALVAVNLTRRFVVNWTATPIYNEADSLGQLTLPPADTTFLTYGFVPTTAKMQLTPLSLLTIVAVGNENADEPTEFTIGEPRLPHRRADRPGAARETGLLPPRRR